MQSSNKTKALKGQEILTESFDVTSEDAESRSYKDVFKQCSFRVCEMCKKTRVLDERARLKCLLGYYIYGGKEERIAFECSMLVETNCDTPEDVTNGEIKDDQIRLVLLKTENTVRPTSGVLGTSK